MGKTTEIEWTDHTFNPWWGCTKVSAACDNCYAEAWARRVGQSVWGHKEPRRFFGDGHWHQPEAWNLEAERNAVRRRVFCASMADVFEDRRDLDATRTRLWQLIADTPFLDWQLLTKRPHAVMRLSPWGKEWPDNVWIGTTIEDQSQAMLRLPSLLKVPARIRFLSCEPLLGALDLSSWVEGPTDVQWIIAGGESGPGARPMEPAWPRTLRDFALRLGIAFHFKQWGHWGPQSDAAEAARRVTVGDTVLYALGKKRSGRELDGKTWDQLPRQSR